MYVVIDIISTRAVNAFSAIDIVAVAVPDVLVHIDVPVLSMCL